MQAAQRQKDPPVLAVLAISGAFVAGHAFTTLLVVLVPRVQIVAWTDFIALPRFAKCA